MHFWVGVHVIEQFLVVEVLLVPLYCFVVAEVVPQRNQQHFTTEQLGFFTVLIKQNPSSETEKVKYKASPLDCFFLLRLSID